MLAFSIILGLLIRSSAGQASVGQECWSSANGVVSGGCASGTQCGPWLPNGGTWNGNDAWYCLYNPQRTSGQSCDYTQKQGPCSSGLQCCSNVCSSSCSSSDTTTSGTGTTTTDSSATTTTPTPCTAQIGDICDDTTLQSTGVYPKTCCDGATCTNIDSTGRTSVCAGSNLGVNATCGTIGTTTVENTCMSNLTCRNGMCENWSDPSNCTTAGMMGYNLCYSGSVGPQKGGICCPDGTKSIACIPSTDSGSTDRYCMEYNLAENAACGTTTADEYKGYCLSGLECINKVCTNTTATTTTASGPTTVTVTTAKACIASGQPCWDASASPPVSKGDCCGTDATTGQNLVCDGYPFAPSTATNNCIPAPSG